MNLTGYIQVIYGSNMQTKICSRCKIGKTTDQFRIRGDKNGFIAYCHPCQKAFDREYWKKTKTRRKPQRLINDNKIRIRNMKFIRNFLINNPCVDCGEQDPIVLEFDHLKDKKHTISNLTRGRSSINRILEEIRKCEVRCANCHRRKTANQLNWYSELFEG